MPFVGNSQVNRIRKLFIIIIIHSIKSFCFKDKYVNNFYSTVIVTEESALTSSSFVFWQLSHNILAEQGNTYTLQCNINRTRKLLNYVGMYMAIPL